MKTSVNSRRRALPSVALALLLSACGGGGGGGGGVVSTPTPSPAPAGNADLVSLTKKESFTNNAVKFDISYGPEVASASSGQANLTIAYDPSNQSYTLSSGSTSEKFAPSERPDPAYSYFEKQTSTGGDSLYLTPNSTEGGYLTYRYVGAGIWDRYSENGSSALENIVMFTYGAETPDSARPKTGNGSYRLDLVANSLDDVYSGIGVLYATFGTGVIAIDGDIDGEYNGGTYAFHADAQMGSGSSFSGQFATGAVEGVGQINGRFYGPGAEEVGATFSTTGPGADPFAGLLIGSRDDTLPPPGSVTLANLTESTDFDFHTAAAGMFWEDAAKAPINYSNLALVSSHVAYDKANSSWYIYANGDLGSQTFTDAQKSDLGDFLFYNDGYRDMTMLKAGPTNSTVALTYASFAKFENVFTDPDTHQTLTSVSYVPFGIATRVMPTTGSATYNGILRGSGIGTSHNYDLTGTSTFSVMFAGQSLTGALTINGTDRASGTNVQFGRFDLNGTFNSNGTIQGSMAPTNTGSGGNLAGAFYGPNASEIAGSFMNGGVPDPQAPTNYLTLIGAYAGKR